MALPLSTMNDDGLRGLGNRSTRRAAHGLVGMAPSVATAVIGVALAASWTLTWLAGGAAAAIVPHGYYVPILFAAMRFGHVGALVVAVIGGVLAGPLTWQVVATQSPQAATEWLTRGAFFVAIGQLTAALGSRTVSSLRAELTERRVARELRAGLARHEFAVRYQPLLRSGDGAVTGLEALVRWEHPDAGEALAPAAFLPAAERSALITEIDAFVLRTALAQAAAWQRHHADAEAVHIAVNVSTAGLDDPGLPERIAAALGDAGLPPDHLWVEITESALVRDFTASVECMRRLRGLGVSVAIDDFGTGYSSLSYLHRFPADVLKVDRSFVEALPHDPPSRSVVHGLVRLAHSLGMTTVAEGVETPAQAAHVIELGCDYAQGFHFAKPLAPDAVTTLLAGHDGQSTANR